MLVSVKVNPYCPGHLFDDEPVSNPPIQPIQPMAVKTIPGMGRAKLVVLLDCRIYLPQPFKNMPIHDG